MVMYISCVCMVTGVVEGINLALEYR